MYENRPIVILDITKYDYKVGESCKSPRVLVGEHALCRSGLTSLRNDTLQLSTLYTGITGIWNPYVMWYFNPFADKYMYTTPSSAHRNILVPTAERALVEYIMLKEYFNEGILIEGLKNYLWRTDGELSSLYTVAEDFKLRKELIDFWVKEALEENDNE